MQIHNDTIAEIHQRLVIEEIIEDHLTLRRKGQNLWGLCPFHEERTPSFSVAPAKGIYKCFGCGKGGDAIQFVMEVQGVNYIEAMLLLAKRYNVQVQYVKGREGEVAVVGQQKESLYLVMEYAAKLYAQCLHEPSQGEKGREYFDKRGLQSSVIKDFSLG